MMTNLIVGIWIGFWLGAIIFAAPSMMAIAACLCAMMVGLVVRWRMESARKPVATRPVTFGSIFTAMAESYLKDEKPSQ